MLRKWVRAQTSQVQTRRSPSTANDQVTGAVGALTPQDAQVTGAGAGSAGTPATLGETGQPATVGTPLSITGRAARAHTVQVQLRRPSWLMVSAHVKRNRSADAGSPQTEQQVDEVMSTTVVRHDDGLATERRQSRNEPTTSRNLPETCRRPFGRSGHGSRRPAGARHTGPMRAIIVEHTGGPDVLTHGEQPDPTPGAGELLVRVAAAGVNFIDTYHRTGLYPRPLPFVPGVEGAGTVVTVGAGVEGFAPGDVVAWSDAPGSYAELTVVPAARAVPVPAGVGAERAGAVVLQGLTAHFLTHDAYRLTPGSRCLIHAAAGGVGLLAVQFAKHLGAEVFATVGSAAKAELARAAGADHVVDYSAEDFGAAVERIAGPRALDVVYDGVGRATFDRGLDLLRPRGVMVTFGNASGPVDPVTPLTLMAKGSLYLTRPTLRDYVATTDDLRARAGDLFARVADGTVDVRIGAQLPLAEAAEAHRRLESRGTTGKLLLTP